MTKSPFSNDWSPGILYRSTLNQDYDHAVVYGFRGIDREQKRYFKSQAEIDAYVGELWFYGFSDVTIEEVSE